VVFEVLSEGVLKLVQHVDSGGCHPRHFKITPDGSCLVVANRDSNNVLAFRRDKTTGMLDRTSDQLMVPAPVCILFA
jgi:6-phosphogluconolactonase